MLWLIAAGGLSAVGVMFGWPWGAVVAAVCVLLPLAVVRCLLWLFPPRVLREPSREPLRVVAVRLTPGPRRLTSRQAIPGPSGDAITERKRP